MSLMRRMWDALRNSARYVGRDFEGNKYFESRSYNDPSRTKRTVQYHDTDDMWKYIGEGKRLPVQWSAWLTHTRRHPPTLEELEADLDRQRRVLSNAQVIEARDKAEAEEMKRVRQKEAHIAIEDAVNIRTKTHWDTSQSPEALGLASETQEAPLESLPKVLPPKFVTPPSPRKARPSKPVQTLVSRGNGGESSPQPDSKSHPVDSWIPKARKRG